MKMPKRLEEKRDELYNKSLNALDKKAGTWCGEGICLGFNACWEELAPEIERYEDMEYRFSCYLDHTTQSMSKTNYTKEAMYEEYERQVEQRIEDRINEMIEDGDLVRTAKLEGEG